ncbi:MAG TPA: hypothetical protein PK796_05910 [Bacteroidales bacterium]|nr:hypothetical protein [Bacteroidales bacterium]
MKAFISLFFSVIITITACAQVQTDWRSGGENIFSWGNAGDPGLKADNVVRFSAFLNQQLQYHVDFGDHAGVYTGLGIRNIGFIHQFGDTLKIKQRVYALGVPLAFKIGNMAKGLYLAFGPEIELFFHFKEKTFLHGQKFKDSEWFSSRTDLIHPSLFAELGLGHGIYLRYRYYLTDFLRKKDVVFPGNIQIPYNNSPSQLMYISIGTMISKKKVKQSLPEIRNTSNTMASGDLISGIKSL